MQKVNGGRRLIRLMRVKVKMQMVNEDRTGFYFKLQIDGDDAFDGLMRLERE